jgi:hypothetical protein
MARCGLRYGKAESEDERHGLPLADCADPCVETHGPRI